MDEGVRPEEEVDGADEAQLAHERHRDGAGEPVAGDQRDASEPVPQVRHAAAAPGRRRGLATSRPLRKRRDEGSAAPAAAARSRRGLRARRGATEFGRAAAAASGPAPAAGSPAPGVERGLSRRCRARRGRGAAGAPFPERRL